MRVRSIAKSGILEIGMDVRPRAGGMYAPTVVGRGCRVMVNAWLTAVPQARVVNAAFTKEMAVLSALAAIRGQNLKDLLVFR